MSPRTAHSDRARTALARMPEFDPAIAALSLWCLHRDGTGHTRTDGDTIHYGPEFPLLPVSEQVGLCAHHVLHVALRHSARRAALGLRVGAGFQASLYDLACDALVNEALLRGGHALPRPAVRASELVERLPPEDRPRDVLAEWGSDQLYFALATAPAKARDKIDGYAEAQGFAPDLGDASPDTSEPDLWAARLEQSLATGSSAGSGIGAVLARFADLPKAEIPWEIRLRRLIQKALTQHPRLSDRRPARSWLARDALARQNGTTQPAFEAGYLRIERQPRVLVCLDTSSSITDADLRLFAAEALTLTRRAGAEAHLFGFDTEVHHRARFDLAEMQCALELRRGGGTDFGPVLAEANGLDPSLIVMFTDLEASLGPPPRAPVIWVVPRPLQNDPPFGEVVRLQSGAAA